MENNIKKLANDFAKNIKDNYEHLNEEKVTYIKSGIVRKINLTMSNICENEVALLVSKVLKKKYNYIIDVYLSYYDDNNKKQSYRPDIVIIDTQKKDNRIINKIVGIIEVKSQMGYCGIITPEDFQKKLRLADSKISFYKEDYEQFNDNVKEYYKSMGIKEAKKECYIECTIGNNINIYIVNVIANNHINNVEGTIYKFKDDKSNVHFYNLFGNNKSNLNIWYNTISYDNIYESDTSTKNVNIPIKKNNKVIETIEYELTHKIREKHGFEQFITDIKKNLDKNI